jgi:predicted small lipoprotein YifL
MLSARFQTVVITALLTLVLAGCGSKGPTSSPSNEEPRPGPTPSPTPAEPVKAKPDYVLTAEAVAEEFSKDREATQKKYRGKLVELTGVLDRPGQTALGEGYFLLVGTTKEPFVQCVLEKEKEPWKKALPGQTVVLRVRGAEVGDGFYDGQIVDVKGKASSPSLTADQLAKEFAADPKAADDQYGGKFLLVTGEVLRADVNEFKTTTAALKAEGSDLRIFFKLAPIRGVPEVKTGQKIKVLGSLETNLGKKELELKQVIVFEVLP